ncbi:short chain dehydrogenase reductase family protein [Ophiostoma piceae UAMH 11346]|uniref:Short chain dehydrogenase reductase family protein n=1 Tax=Ophiostoma piceae (strain UAMH 11346) TaxID=1262450 RepID=S3BXX9_OPHP1|nr:short chain dehydrogenase reductase family protein [Ophiostoma piceae UAMH 11346]
MSLSTTALFRVDGTVAVITGGGTGIGLIMARALATNGARRVFILGRRKDVVESAAAAANKELGVTDVLMPVVCDVTDKASIQASVDAVSANLAGPDKTGSIGVNLLVCNAGTGGPHTFYDPKISVSALRQRMFTDADPAAMTDAFHVNVTGAYFTAMAYLELLDAGNQSSPDNIQSQIVVTSSIASFMRGHYSSPPYAGSKMAILQITKQLAAMLSPYKIRANALAPGLFPTGLAEVLTKGRDPSTEGYDHPAFIPARRFGTDADMAGTILYLASTAGGFCNGLVMAFDGGRLAVTNANY